MIQAAATRRKYSANVSGARRGCHLWRGRRPPGAEFLQRIEEKIGLYTEPRSTNNSGTTNLTRQHPITASIIRSQHPHIACLSHDRSTMPSRSNPNVPNRERRKSSRAKVQKRNSLKVHAGRNPRGMAVSSVLHPTGGKFAPLSAKKARKVEKALNHARKRAEAEAMEERGEVEMTGMCTVEC